MKIILFILSFIVIIYGGFLLFFIKITHDFSESALKKPLLGDKFNTLTLDDKNLIFSKLEIAYKDSLEVWPELYETVGIYLCLILLYVILNIVFIYQKINERTSQPNQRPKSQSE